MTEIDNYTPNRSKAINFQELNQTYGENMSPMLKAAILLLAFENAENLQQILAEHEEISFWASLPKILKYDVKVDGDNIAITILIKKGNELVKENIQITPHSINISQNISGRTPKGKKIDLNISESIQQTYAHPWSWSLDMAQFTNIKTRVSGTIGDEKIDITENILIDCDEEHLPDGSYKPGYTMEDENFSGNIEKVNKDGEVTSSVNINESSHSLYFEKSDWRSYYVGIPENRDTRTESSSISATGDFKNKLPSFLNQFTKSQNICEAYNYHPSGIGLRDLMAYLALTSPVGSLLSSIDPGILQGINPFVTAAALIENGNEYDCSGYGVEFTSDEIHNYSDLLTQSFPSKEIEKKPESHTSFGLNKLIQEMLQELLRTLEGSESEGNLSPHSTYEQYSLKI